MHGVDVLGKNAGELLGVNMLLEDGQDLVEKLLLMEVVELQGGVHLVDHRVLVDESWKLVHDGSSETAIVAEANVDVIARNDSTLLV